MPVNVKAEPEIRGANLRLWLSRSLFLRYGIAGTSVGIALGLALLSEHYNFHNVEVPLFLFAVALTAWYAGSGPAGLGVVLSIVLFDFFFVQPLYSLDITVAEVPYFTVFVGFACLVAWFSVIRKARARKWKSHFRKTWR